MTTTIRHTGSAQLDAMGTPATTTPVVDVRDVHKTYGDVRAVDGIDLRVGQGEVVAILGPNGAGKTTLIEIMLGLRTADAGEVRLFGTGSRHVHVKARVGAMLQDTDVPEMLTVGEIVALVGRYYPFALPTAEVLQRAELSAQAGQRANKLSGGQRQRLSFAMAIVGDPDILFLDEPTAALDVEARRAFWTQVRGFAALGKTVLFSSHNMEEVAALAQRVVVVNHGRIIADGHPTEIAATIATRTISLVTDADAETLTALPGVHGVVPEHESDRLVLTTPEPERVLKEIFARGYAVSRLSVSDADLESAFLHLTAAPAAPASPADTKDAS
jgi:ABC-2 type transport system ATP-binding protein